MLRNNSMALKSVMLAIGTRTCAAVIAGLLFLLPLHAHAQRKTISLDGTWSIADSIVPDAMPVSFSHTVSVPGLAHSATPRFPDVDRYETYAWYYTVGVRDHIVPNLKPVGKPGRNMQPRNYFWYERTFRAPERRRRARLVINKAQFGTAVWLNGKKVGEHMGNWTAAHFDLTAAMNWKGENRLLIRIGADPGAIPPTVPVVGDGEKEFWTPGIYDDVTLLLSNDPEIESTQVAPRIHSSEILVQTELVNQGPARTITLTQRVKTWKTGSPVGKIVRERISLAAGEHRFVQQTVPIPNERLWTPHDPFLYVVETSSGGDNATTRFGMREFYFANGKAILNGKVIYMRGATITLHRFFADPDSGQLPWNDAWVRKFLVTIPKQMHWNAFRICIGPAPEHWLDVADEGGILIEDEFPIWDDRPPYYHNFWSKSEVLTEFKEFVRDDSNHPSVVLWAASNETHWPYVGEKIIPAVRVLDLSHRPWDDGYNGPQAPGDPYTIHPYKFPGYYYPKDHPKFKMSDLETMAPEPVPWPGHAAIINEYDWLWLHRDGRPTWIDKPVYKAFLGPDSTADQNYFMDAYFLAGLTEHWRATRKYAAVMYLAYLDADGPYTDTGDNFRHVQTLEFMPYFKNYMEEAFKPLGVNLTFWESTLQEGAKRSFTVVLTNDTDKRLTGKLKLSLEPVSGPAAGKETEAAADFDVPALGQNTYNVELNVPQASGKFQLEAVAGCGESWCPTLSRRRVTVVP